MEKKNYEKFIKLTEDFLEMLKERHGISPSSVWWPSQDYPEVRCRFKSWGLRKWTMGIWPTGEWSEFYDTDAKENKIAVFFIHDWTLDKFRPSSADILYEIWVEEDSKYLDITHIVDEIYRVKKNSIMTYYGISRNRETNPNLLYLEDWWFDKKFRVRNLMRYIIGPRILYGVMRFISSLDRRVEKVVVFDEPGTMPRYTFGFLATKKFSRKSDKEFERFYNLYSRFPERLSRKIGIDARWNVSDWSEEINEKQLRTRLFKGIYIEHYETED